MKDTTERTSGKPDWRTVSSKRAYECPWFYVTEDTVITDNDHTVVFSVIHKKPFVVLIPYDGTYVTMVRQYRYMVGAYSWEFPGGTVEDLDVIRTGELELAEEAGLRAGHMEIIGSYWVGAGLTTQEGVVILAERLTPVPAKHVGAESRMEVKPFSVKQVGDMIRKHRIVDAPTIAAFGYFAGFRADDIRSR